MFLPKNAKARAEKRWAMDGVIIHLFDRLPNGSIEFVSNLVMTAQGPEEVLPFDSGIGIGYQTAQELMDSLWDCGLRPSEGAGSAGAMAATQDHLKTLKDISNRLLKIVEAPPVVLTETREKG